MSEAADPAGGVRRSNPLVFPSETTLRFVLLVVFALGGSASLSATMWGAFNQPIERAVDACVAGFIPFVAQPTGDPATVGRDQILPRIAACSALLRPKVAWQCIGVAITLALSAVLFWCLPLFMLRRGLRPVTASDAPGLLEEVQGLCQSVGLRKTPALFWNPLAMTTPQVFGGAGRYYCAFGGAFVVRLYSDRPLFRTIVLHELAHIQCGDVGKTYFAIATCIAFLANAIVQCMWVVLFARADWSSSFEMLLQSIMWVSVIALSGASILRAREYYADVQTSAWQATPANLVRILSASSSSSSVTGWRRYLRLHPTPDERRAAVVDPSALFHLSAWDAFAVGFAAWLAIDILKGGAAAFVPHDLRLMMIFQVLVMTVLPACILVLAVGAVGIGVWREAFADLVRGKRATTGSGRLGLMLGASSLLPGSMNLLRAGIGESQVPFAMTLHLVLLDVSIGLAVTLGCFLVFRWIADAASAWFGVVLHSRSPRKVLFCTILTVLLLVVGILASASFAMYFYWMAGAQAGADPFTAVLLAAQVVGIPAFIASAVVWGFPLAAGLWHRHAAHRPPADWVFLDDPAPTLPATASWRPTGALAIGLAAGLASCLLLEMVYFATMLPTWLAEAVRGAFSWLRSWMQRSVGNDGAVIPAIAGLFQLIAAIVVAATARRFQTLSALFAAFVAGNVAAVFNLLFFPMDPSRSPAATLLAPMMLVAIGSLISLPVSIAIAWLTAARPDRGSGTVPGLAPVASRTSGRVWLARGLVASLCVAVGFGAVMRYRNTVVAEQARHALVAAAESGDAAAQARLAMSYLNGGALPRDAAQAAFWMLKAAENGNSEAMYRLGVMYFSGLALPQSDNLAAHWLLISAGKGNRDAIRDLGVVYLAGRVPENPGLVLDLLRSASGNGNADAQNSLGLAYRFGRGTTQDDGKALEWFRRAADQNHAAGLTNLAWMYHLGLGSAQDEAAAVALFTRAATLGYAEAQYILGQIQAEGKLVHGDETQAAMWLRKAAGQGYAPAVQRLHELCDRGVRPACG